MDFTNFEEECKKRLKQKFIYEWKIKLKESSKLILYDQIKHIFEKEKYLDDIDCFQMRKSITKFRCSDHKLKIEIGRHKKIPREERFCESCRSEVETESHFLSSALLTIICENKYLEGK